MADLHDNNRIEGIDTNSESYEEMKYAAETLMIPTQDRNVVREEIVSAGSLEVANSRNRLATDEGEDESDEQNPRATDESESEDYSDEGYSSESEENQNLADEAGGVMSQASERVDTSTGEDKPLKRYVFNHRQKALLEKRFEDRPEPKQFQLELNSFTEELKKLGNRRQPELNPSKVITWYRNRKAKLKRESRTQARELR